MRHYSTAAIGGESYFDAVGYVVAAELPTSNRVPQDVRFSEIPDHWDSLAAKGAHHLLVGGRPSAQRIIEVNAPVDTERQECRDRVCIASGRGRLHMRSRIPCDLPPGVVDEITEDSYRTEVPRSEDVTKARESIRWGARGKGIVGHFLVDDAVGVWEPRSFWIGVGSVVLAAAPDNCH